MAAKLTFGETKARMFLKSFKRIGTWLSRCISLINKSSISLCLDVTLQLDKIGSGTRNDANLKVVGTYDQTKTSMTEEKEFTSPARAGDEVERLKETWTGYLSVAIVSHVIKVRLNVIIKV